MILWTRVTSSYPNLFLSHGRNRLRVHSLFLRLLTVLGALVLGCCQPRYADPLTPDDAIKSFHLRDGFRIEIFATEPDVMDPVDMVFDELGNAYVVEMPDYPFKPEPGKEAGRIKMLSDTDGDGRVDHATIFADSLSEATGILPWEGGLIVTSAPYILFLKDTNADFRADTKEVLFSGFFDTNSEAQITSLRFGIDNWIYAANNGQPGEVTFSKRPDAPALPMAGSDFRFRLDREQFELETGQGQFGLTMDDWGHRFITQNTLHIRQVVIPWRYLNRHPYLPPANPLLNISDHDLIMYQETPPPYWRAERTKRRQKQYKEEHLDREEYAEDHFTGSSGGTVYAGDRFPAEYYGNVFTGDVAGNLIHRDILKPPDDSPVFVAQRDTEERNREFLASTDPWFRPANFAVGPDGFLYVIDMYRQHIETPVSIPDDLKADMDFLNGSKYGRIYRIMPDTSASPRSVSPGLKKKTTADYVALLAHPNRWWRLQAQRLLLERQDVSVVPLVIPMFSKSEDARTRLHALYVLEGLNSLNATLVTRAMTDPHPGVREHGMILSERFPELLPRLISAVDDTAICVAFQATLSLGQFSGPKVTAALASVVERHGSDPWFRTAVLSSVAGSSVDLLRMLCSRSSFLEQPSPEKESFMENISFVIGARNEPEEIISFLDLLSKISSTGKQAWQAVGIKGFTSGVEKSKSPDDHMKEIAETVRADSAQEIGFRIRHLKELFSKRSGH